MALRVGYDKLNAETGWTPTISWEEGLRRTIAWYAANRDALGRPRRLDAERGPRARQGGGRVGFRRLSRDARARHRRCRLPRLVPRRAARGARRRGHGAAPGGVRPDPLGRRRAAVRGGPAGDRLPPGRRGRRDRRQPGEPRALLVREPDHGRAHARALAAARRRGSSSSPAPSAPTRSSRRRRSTRTSSGTATPRRRTRRTASRRSRCSSAGRPTASSTGSRPSTSCRRTSTGRVTTSTSRPRTSCRP